MSRLVRTQNYFVLSSLALVAFGCSSPSPSPTQPTVDSGVITDTPTTTDIPVTPVDTGPNCGVGSTLCGASCVDTHSSNLHCGACDHPCATGEVCSNGTCSVQCTAGLSECTSGGTDGGQLRACVNLASDSANCGMCNNICPAGQRCSNGTCTVSCSQGTTDCTGTCRDLQSDNLHCGACDRACADGQVCSMGTCRVSCIGGTTDCAGACRDTSTDRLNCGACGHACLPGQVCSMGACTVTCTAGTTDCTGACRDLTTDRLNCGACGNTCAAGEACVSGTCAVSCATGTTACAGTCRDLTTDRLNCGACGHACADGQVCTGSTCVATCSAGLTECSGACVSLATDPTHCGTCGTACPDRANAARYCTGSVCGFTCAAGFGDCNSTASDGCEAALDTTAHCGSCGRVCTYPNAAAMCTAGACAMGACNTGFADCDSNPTNGCEVNLGADRSNCGACGIACGAGQVCSGGTCVASCGIGLSTCSGACVDTAHSPDHCGTCGVSCPAAPTNGVRFCASGVCGTACRPNYGDCDNNTANGCEASLADSVTNCGRCGNACPMRPHSSVSCMAGACTDTCSTGYANCDGNASNGCEASLTDSTTHCGACGNACSLGQSCVAGVCTVTGGFSTAWVAQGGTRSQFTRCASVSVNGLQRTCNTPEVRYGTVEGGVPYQHPGNDLNAWCLQLGFRAYVSATYGSRGDVSAPRGRLFGCTSYDETTWHWCDWQDGYWYNQRLDYHTGDSTGITAITCTY